MSWTPIWRKRSPRVEKDYRVKVEQEVFSNTRQPPNTPAIMNALTTGAKNLGLKSAVLPLRCRPRHHDLCQDLAHWHDLHPQPRGLHPQPRGYTDPRNLANGADLIAEAIQILDAQ